LFDAKPTIATTVVSSATGALVARFAVFDLPKAPQEPCLQPMMTARNLAFLAITLKVLAGRSGAENNGLNWWSTAKLDQLDRAACEV
jgi:hypothetical protein